MKEREEKTKISPSRTKNEHQKDDTTHTKDKDIEMDRPLSTSQTPMQKLEKSLFRLFIACKKKTKCTR